MSVRVRVSVTLHGKSVDAVAVVNTGFESLDAEILLPLKLAQKMWPREVKKAKTATYHTAGGPARFKGLGAASVRVLARDHAPTESAAQAMTSSAENEVIISDVLAQAFGIEILKPAEGVWRFQDDPPGTTRASEKREPW